MTRRPVSRIFSTDAGMTVLLVSLFVVVFVIYPYVPLSGFGRLVVNFGLTVVLVAGSFSLSDRRWRIGVYLVAAAALAGNWLQQLVSHDAVLYLAYASTLAFLALVAGGVLARVLRPGRVTHHHIQGAVAVYLMLGLIWGFAYSLVELSRPGSFRLPEPAAAGASQHPGDPVRDLVYFSFVTLTTLGYGDVTPKSPSARNLATLEALIGQLYLVTLIARLVSQRAGDGQDGGAPP